MLDSPETNRASTASRSASPSSTRAIRRAASPGSSATGAYRKARPALCRSSTPLACSRDKIVTTVV